MGVQLKRTDLAKLALEQLRRNAQKQVDDCVAAEDAAEKTLRAAVVDRFWTKLDNGLADVCQSVGINPTSWMTTVNLGTTGDWLVDPPNHVPVVLRDGPPATARIMLRCDVTITEAMRRPYIDAIQARIDAQTALERVDKGDAAVAMVEQLLTEVPEGAAVMDAVRIFNRALKNRG